MIGIIKIRMLDMFNNTDLRSVPATVVVVVSYRMSKYGTEKVIGSKFQFIFFCVFYVDCLIERV